MNDARSSLSPLKSAPKRARITLIAVSLLIPALLAAAPGSAQVTFGPLDPDLGGVPAYISGPGVPTCYPFVDPAELPDPLSPMRYPDNIPDEFPYYDLRTRVPVVGGGTLRFRDTIQAFGLDPGGLPVIRNFIRITLEGLAPGTYGILDEPQGALAGTTFTVANTKELIEVMFITAPTLSEGPVQDISIRSAPLTIVRDGLVVVSATADDFVGCEATPPVVAPRTTVPVAHFSSACGLLRCALDARNSIAPGGGSIVAYQWELDGGLIVYGDTLVHTFAGPGPHVVKLTVIDNFGVQDSMTDTVFTFDASSPPPAANALGFSGVRTNNFLGVLASPGGDVTEVSVSVNHGPFTPMTRVNTEEWRAAAPPRDSLVQFHAKFGDSTSKTSPDFLWPSFSLA